MALAGERTFVGFGFGAIQAGLFLYEALQSGNFRRLVVAEVVPDVVAAVRQAGGYYRVNIAHADRVEQAQVGPIEILNPAVDEDRRTLIDAIAAAEEIATAVPGVNYYASPAPGSLHRLLAAGLRAKLERRGPPAVVYAAENHNHAAEILTEHVLSETPPDERSALGEQVRFLNTVIGKMSGVVDEPQEIEARGLSPVTPGGQRAFLVEAFNRILISQIALPGLRRGISVFEEKADLLPFEEAKLYGHNATHALAAYVAAMCGVQRIADLAHTPGMLTFLRAAFINESGAALIRRWQGVDDLFTPAGYALYADDLLQRMVNPFLGDTVERVGRDAQRKLGWDDRLIGVMRTALDERIEPRRYALGAAAALATLHPEIKTHDEAPLAPLLDPLWQGAPVAGIERTVVLSLVGRGLVQLKKWIAGGYPDLESLLNEEFLRPE